MEKKIDPLVELAVWGHLDEKTDLELILLKGHLLLEMVLDTVLSRCEVQNFKNFSFHSKVLVFEKIEFEDYQIHEVVVARLKELNKLRNKLAHEFTYDVYSGDFESLSVEVLNNLKGRKYTRFTFRTKIVHSFSVLSINMLNLSGQYL